MRQKEAETLTSMYLLEVWQLAVELLKLKQPERAHKFLDVVRRGLEELELDSEER